ncbi:MAG: inorganic phosphate transporter [Bacteroidales bacterium]|nr:inorganic phosphate transporter [Bacteroidales bacterium]
MDNLYLIFVVLLFLLAISDLIVGVSNDAVNFLNSAIGSKAASFKTIMLIAAAGVLIGALFSGGMMEVARKGIFHPGQFYFSEIMIIFLAVMITDVILLDLFNTFGLPTSTTVSIVFELLGAAVAISYFKIKQSADTLFDFGKYINSDKALAIISGILISVIVAFTVGALVQYLARLLFTFKLGVSIKSFGAIFGGLAISCIVYFIMLKGANGASFMNEKTVAYIAANIKSIFLINFVFWTLVCQVIIWLKVNPLKFVVLVGTFALAMAFAGNDLVNFIGVPLAGYESFKAFVASGAVDPNAFTMDKLQSAVKTPTFFLLIAGVVMVATLWFSKKAQSVVKTTINLSRQEEGHERFESSAVARELVRMFLFFSFWVKRLVPMRIHQLIEKRFDKTTYNKVMGKDKTVAFDELRAATNLVVASILIATATSLRLPLSTTYVTFMVAMGTSLADRAWDRESAVYRITGVITVVGGWFFTALSAFIFSLIVAALIYKIGSIAIFAFIGLAIFFVVRTHAIHAKRSNEELLNEIATPEETLYTGDKILERSNLLVIETLEQTKVVLDMALDGVCHEKRKKLMSGLRGIKNLEEYVFKLNKDILRSIKKIEDNKVEINKYHIQVAEKVKLYTERLKRLVRPLFLHVNNHHSPLLKYMASDAVELFDKIKKYIDGINVQLRANEIVYTEKNKKAYDQLIVEIDKMQHLHIKQIKKDNVNTRLSILYMDLLKRVGQPDRYD